MTDSVQPDNRSALQVAIELGLMNRLPCPRFLMEVRPHPSF
jgi:hypothetical protein